MPDYKKSKIYKIVCNVSGDIYVGSTTLTLMHRLSLHKNKSNTSSCKIIKNGDYVIKLIEDYPCKTKDDLCKREQYYIDSLECVNQKRSYVTEEQKLETNHKKSQKYRDNHKEFISERNKVHYDNFTDDYKKERNSKKLKSYHINKEQISARRKEKYEASKIKCDNCNKLIGGTPGIIKRHKQSPNCINF